MIKKKRQQQQRKAATTTAAATMVTVVRHEKHENSTANGDNVNLLKQTKKYIDQNKFWKNK